MLTAPSHPLAQLATTLTEAGARKLSLTVYDGTDGHPVAIVPTFGDWYAFESI